MAAAPVRQIKAETAVDLGADGWVKEARRRRALSGMTAEVEAETSRLIRRASWLQRKAARLPLRSNGRRSATVEAASCQALAQILPLAQQGKATPRFAPPPAKHLQRAVGLLHTLQTAE